MRERLFPWSAVLLLLAAPVLAGTAMLVNRPQANVRAEANAQAARVASLRQGEEVELLERRAEWCRIRTPDGQEGWIHGDLMLEEWVVTATTARVRSAGSTSAPPVAAVAAGDEITKLSQRGGWLEVSLPDGKTGWIASNLVRAKTISLTPATRPRPTPPSRPASAPAEAAKAAPAADGQEAPAVPAVADSGATRSNAYAEGLQHAIAGDYEAALASFEAVLAQDPQNLNALFNAVKAHRQLGQYDRALAKLYRIMSLNRNRRDLFRELSEVYQATGKPDSAAKYQALFRGQEWEPGGAEEATGSLTPSGGKVLTAQLERVPWIMVAAGVGAVGVLALVLFLLLRRRPESLDEDLEEPPAPAGRGRFAQTMRQTATRAPALDRGAEEELNRQIEAKRSELRQSSEAFLGPAPLGKGVGSEDQHLEEVLGHLEDLRTALHLQDERERIYADLVRLQGMKLEVMEREMALLRRRSRG